MQVQGEGGEKCCIQATKRWLRNKFACRLPLGESRIGSSRPRATSFERESDVQTTYFNSRICARRSARRARSTHLRTLKIFRRSLVPHAVRELHLRRLRTQGQRRLGWRSRNRQSPSTRTGTSNSAPCTKSSRLRAAARANTRTGAERSMPTISSTRAWACAIGNRNPCSPTSSPESGPLTIR